MVMSTLPSSPPIKLKKPHPIFKVFLQKADINIIKRLSRLSAVTIDLTQRPVKI